MLREPSPDSRQLTLVRTETLAAIASALNAMGCTCAMRTRVFLNAEPYKWRRRCSALESSARAYGRDEIRAFTCSAVAVVQQADIDVAFCAVVSRYL